jgi:MFS transporter, CP family, cyanate transporter
MSDAFGWRFSVGIWSLLGLTAALPWSGLIQDHNAEDHPHRPIGHAAWCWTTTWAITVLFKVGALDMYALIVWLPQMLTTTAGVSAATAGVMLSIYDSMGFPHSLLVPIVTRWYEANPRHNRRKSRFCPDPGSYLRWRTERAAGES